MVQKAKSMYRSAQCIREAPHNVSAEFFADVILNFRQLKKRISASICAFACCLTVIAYGAFAYQFCTFTVLLFMSRRVFLLAKNFF